MSPTIPETTPRSLEVLLAAVRAEVCCPRCGARPGTGCAWQGRRGVHLHRFIRALILRAITVEEMAVVLAPWPDGNYSVATIVRDGDR